MPSCSRLPPTAQRGSKAQAGEGTGLMGSASVEPPPAQSSPPSLPWDAGATVEGLQPFRIDFARGFKI